MLLQTLVTALFTVAVSAKGEERKFSTFEPSLTGIKQTAATATVASYKDMEYVPGKAFDRFYNIWLENTDYEKADGQQDLKELAKQGIKLSNYWAVTHPSMPNYLASAAGDYFGLDHDEFVTVPENVSNIADLLDTKGISWAEYQEHAPYAGFQGMNFSNQENYANDYVRKHNPLVLMGNVANNKTRLSNIKNFTSFQEDLDNKALPQWSFITPNMTNDGHDSTIQVSGRWSARFLKPLLKNKYFTEKTLVVLTFDENETYERPNRVLALLLGDIPEELKGTTDDTYYDHYSLLSTVQANWGLNNLGRNDCGANVFDIVANKIGWKNKKVDMDGIYNNKSVPGWFSDNTIPFPAPKLQCEGAGGPVLPAIVKTWGKNNESGASNSTTGGGSNSTANSSAPSPSSSTLPETNMGSFVRAPGVFGGGLFAFTLLIALL